MWKWMLLSCLFAFIFHFVVRQNGLQSIRRLIGDKNQEHGLIIGILSSQSNFLQRKAIRETWLTMLNKTRNSNTFVTKTWFIVGKDPCQIPALYRLNSYDCLWWKINITAILASRQFISNSVVNKNCDDFNTYPIYQGFSFQVNYPVVITKLGVLSEVMTKNNNVTITLLNGPSREIVIQATISSDYNASSNLENNYLYHSVTQYLLPKGFEGILLIEGLLSNSACLMVEWNNGSGLLTYQRIYKTAEDFNSVEFFDKYLVAPSFVFIVPNKDELVNLENNKNNAIKKWKKSLQFVQLQLKEEMKTWNDIFLADVTEIYRNLPLKILKFLSWLSINYKFSYFLKTDDDCMIDIPKIIHELTDTLKFNPKEKWWWSRFRYNWAVNYFGKWKDHNYPSVVYPAFPCGGGYVLSSDLVRWVVRNNEFLYQYQGEDVSMGVWMAAVNPIRIEDTRWNCEEGCRKNSFNRVQLSLDEMYTAWSSYMKCGNICTCK